MNCHICQKPLTYMGAQTVLNYAAPIPGHDHQDNCAKKLYYCTHCKGERIFSKRNKCPTPGCTWQGVGKCACCGKKVEEWPA